MPVRIYDISQKLGLENKDILSKAKSLGIASAKVPSSSLDKISAEWLEEELLKEHPEIVARLAPKPVTPVIADESKIRVISAPPPHIQYSPVKPVSSQQSPYSTTSVAPEPKSVRFENEVRKFLDQRIPHATLSNILIFNAARARFEEEANGKQMGNDYAFEIDHLIHQATDTLDRLLLIECKAQPVTVKNETTWEVRYRSRPDDPLSENTKNVQLQILRQAAALRNYVNPLSRGRKLKIDCVVVSSEDSTPLKTRHVDGEISLQLCNYAAFRQAIPKLAPHTLAIVQSDLLGLLRLSLPVEELGHPELNNAIAYVERCRRSLDAELFRAFEPTKERWAINGSAGMGKSVLLSYSLFCLTTDRRVQMDNGTKSLVDFASTANALGISPLGQRGVYAFALKEKQRAVIDVLYRRFVDEFSSLSKISDLGIRRPVIRVWNGKIPDDCHVLVLDEAHDLPAKDAKVVADWLNTADKPRYLVIACDRHQKLRLVGRDESIIDGISFSLKTKKLRLNYRNPFSVYAASLGLMFRWFADAGPKVIPTDDDLRNGFGFLVETSRFDGYAVLSMRNDAHPANYWSHTVSTFPSCHAALARLRPNRLSQQDVLWVRFSDEDDSFDYEQLSHFTYHNLNSPESVDLVDKYIKGQDFPIVVIEGFSDDINDWKDEEAEQLMWQRRRQLYICASRATTFLFFVIRQDPSGSNLAAQEIANLVQQLSTPQTDPDRFDRTWRLTISPTDKKRRMDVFKDVNEQPPLPPKTAELIVPEQMTVKELADALKQKPFKIIADLMGLNVFATLDQQISFEVISEVSRKYGYATKRKV